jgi:predicted TIM-barrel fold metal-dependent hydrolase
MLSRVEHPIAAASVAAVDVHAHLGRWLTTHGGWMAPDVGALLAAMDACNLATVVNLDGRWGDELEANLTRYDRAHPDRFVTFCQLDWALLEERTGPAQLVRSLEHSARLGARGVKVWKDLGLTVRVRGRLLMPDDPVLAPVWETAGALGLPVLIHVADPVAFFQPPDRHNERLEEILRFPSVSLADQGMSAFTRLIEGLEVLVARHPATHFIGAHGGCYAENLAWVSEMLDRYPNFWIDIAARAELGRQPRTAARLIAEHSDRVLFGADIFPFDAREYACYFRLLETEDEYFPYSAGGGAPTGRWAISGLGLEPGLLEKVYRTNAGRLLGYGSPAVDGTVDPPR